MKLGVRYIAILNEDGVGDFVHAHTWKNADFAASTAMEYTSDRSVAYVRALVVDLDSLPPASATEVEQHESQFVYHGEWLVRQSMPTPIIDELTRLRERCAAMESVVESAEKFTDAWRDNKPRSSGTLGPLYAAVDAYRSHAQPQPQTKTTEPPNCAACNEHCNSDYACGNTHHYCGCECHRAQERWALGSTP